MALSGSGLAEEIRSAMNFPSPTSTQLIGWATGIVEEITTNGMATFGTIAGPHPISGLTGSSMAGKVANYAGYPGVSAQLLNFCTAIANHIMTNGVVTYAGPPPAPPAIPPSAAWYTGGTISGLSGSLMASDVASAVGFPGVSAPLLNKCTAIANHIMTNAQVESGVIS